MPPFLIALMFGVGVGTFAWTKLVRVSGNAQPAKIAGGAAIVGLIAFFVLYSFLAWILHV